MIPRRHMLWLRIQETPMELTFALIAMISGLTNLLVRTDALSAFAIALYVVLAVGGLCVTVGRLRDSLPIESVGLALLLGGYAFVTLRTLSRANTAVEITAVILATGALSLGIGVRLAVVRKAIRVRRNAFRLMHGLPIIVRVPLWRRVIGKFDG